MSKVVLQAIAADVAQLPPPPQEFVVHPDLWDMMTLPMAEARARIKERGTRWLSRTRPDNRKARRAAQAGGR